MSISGKITIDMNDAGHCGSGDRDIRIRSSRKTNVARFLKGKQPQEAVQLLPAIYSVCAVAQASAAAIACRQRPVHKDVEIADQLVVCCESAREHVLRIFTGWSHNVKADIDHIPFNIVMGLVNKMRAAVGTEVPLVDTSRPGARPNLDQKQIRQVAAQLSKFLQTHIFHAQPREWLAMTMGHQLVDWADKTDTVAANFITRLYQQNWQSAGASATCFLPGIPLADLADKMHGADSEDFLAHPVWQNKACETGPFSRHHDHPLINNLVDQYGSGILARQVARLVELAKIPAQIEMLLEPEAREQQPEHLLGVGQVETARGQLTHSAVIADGKIVNYKILAPTEWNFHPNGVVHKALNSLQDNLQSRNQAETEALAKMIVEAIDPCVAFDVRVH